MYRLAQCRSWSPVTTPFPYAVVIGLGTWRLPELMRNCPHELPIAVLHDR
jgi:hypothetical protein